MCINRMLPFAIFSALSLLLVGCAPKAVDQAVQEGGRPLSATALQKVVEGNTLHMDQYGELADLELAPDGQVRATNHEGDTDEGWWQIDGFGRLCLKFRKWKHGDPVCATVFEVGNEYRQFTTNGALVSTFTVSAGTSQPAAPARPPPAVVEEAPAGGSPSRVEDPVAEVNDEPAPPAAPDSHAEQDLRLIYREMARNCPGCNLANLRLPGAELIRAALAGADLSGADLSKANLRRADLREARLVGADLSGADLGGADLRGADLTGARLTGANLRQANLQDALLQRTTGADLSGAIQ